MSYLVDALRKAEHERRQAEVPATVALSAHAGAARAAGMATMGWAIALLVVCNLLLFGYLLWPSPAQVAPEPVADMATHETPGVSAASADQAGAAQAAHPSAPAQPDADTASTAKPADTAAASGAVQATPNSVPDTGQDTTRTPVVLPRVRVHGHLYSTNPSESFILVGGHVYHEGERLPSGATVVRIGPTGALLDYQGRRFHVDGPG